VTSLYQALHSERGKRRWNELMNVLDSKNYTGEMRYIAQIVKRLSHRTNACKQGITILWMSDNISVSEMIISMKLTAICQVIQLKYIKASSECERIVPQFLSPADANRPSSKLMDLPPVLMIPHTARRVCKYRWDCRSSLSHVAYGLYMASHFLNF